jgi:hypothetical protein
MTRLASRNWKMINLPPGERGIHFIVVIIYIIAEKIQSACQ